jgi:hypothetical protein
MRDYELIAEMPSISTGKAKSHFCRRRQIKIALMQFLVGKRIRDRPNKAFFENFWLMTMLKIVKFFVNINKNIQTLVNAQLFAGAIKDCNWLKYKSFSPGGWAMDNAALYTLFRIFNKMKPKNILEFGLGESSKLVHQYATFFEDIKAETIENDNDWINFFRNDFPEDIEIHVKQFDKEIVNFNGYETFSYKNIDEIIMGGAGWHDLIIVDGPLGSKHYSRSQSVGVVKNNLGERFCIFFDDSQRIGEKETIHIICNILDDKKIKYYTKNYIGEEKQHTIICTADLKFLTSLR